MKTRRYLLMLMAGLVGCGGPSGCRSTDSANDPGARPRTESSGAPSSSASTQSLPCKTDADCPPLACGPCTPGEVIKGDRVAVNCAINPCLDARAVCSPAGICVVNAEARKNPSVWCRTCWELEHDAPKLCGAKTAAAKSACERTIRDAVAKCDDGVCEAARSAIAR
jgi:hypothetical protein